MTNAMAQLNRRIEEASLNAWPAMQQMLFDGWLLRFAGGFTKRSNSVVPLYAASLPIADKVHFCENLYARERLQTIFRLTSTSDRSELDCLLDERGYRRIDPTLVLSADLNDHARLPMPEGWQLLPPGEWLQAYAAATHLPETSQQLHSAILEGIRTDCGFAVLRQSDEVLACGLGVVEQGLLGLFDIVTHPGHRREGHARRLVQGLLAWGAQQGADTTYLQMLETNAAAHALYSGFGFIGQYHYWYRISP